MGRKSPWDVAASPHFIWLCDRIHNPCWVPSNDGRWSVIFLLNAFEKFHLCRELSSTSPPSLALSLSLSLTTSHHQVTDTITGWLSWHILSRWAGSLCVPLHLRPLCPAHLGSIFFMFVYVCVSVSTCCLFVPFSLQKTVPFV